MLLMDTDHVILSALQPETARGAQERAAGRGGRAMAKGQLIVISGPSGVGKSTVVRSLTAKRQRQT